MRYTRTCWSLVDSFNEGTGYGYLGSLLTHVHSYVSLSGVTWGHTYEGPKAKRRYLSETMRGMRARRSRGAKGARGDDTYQRVSAILITLDDGPVCSEHVTSWARTWDISIARVEQLIAEARRTRKRLKRLERA